MASTARIDSAVERSALVGDALSVARATHGEQTRETGNGRMPFMEHLLAVAERVAAAGCPEPVLAAALLHDAIENGDADPGALRARFGEQVGELVEAMTEDEAIAAYEERKAEHRARLSRSSPEARAIFAADKTANVAVVREAYAARGEDVDERLPIPLDRKIVVWEGDLEMLLASSPDSPLVEDFAEEMVGLWGQRAGGERASLA